MKDIGGQKQEESEKGKSILALDNLKSYIKLLYQGQKETPWQSLFGPGPKHRASLVLTHLWYIFILSFIPCCSFLTGLGFLQPYLSSDTALCDWQVNRRCASIVLLFVAYRVGFAVTLFFCFTACLLLKVTKANISEISTLHTGFWIEKIFMILILSCLGFAFSTNSFDSVWLYFILVGDLVISIVQVFLLSDLVKDVHSYLLSCLNKKQGNILLRCLILFMEIVTPLGAGLIFLSLSIYSAVMKIYNQTVGLVITVTSVTVTLCLFSFALTCRRRELLSTIYIIAYFMFLIFKSTSYNSSYYPDDVSRDELIPPGIYTGIALLFLYLTVIYALVRKDRDSHFYHFYWILSGERSEIDRDFLLLNKNLSEREYTERLNSQETLLDLSFQKTPENSSKEQAVSPRSEFVKKKYIKIEYNETFIHCFLFFVSLKSTGLVSGYYCLKEHLEDAYIAKTFPPIIFLQLTFIVALLLYFWYLFNLHSEEIDPLWTLGLIRTLIVAIWKMSYVLFIKVPVCFVDNILSRYIYLMFYLWAFILSSVVLSPNFRRNFESYSIFCEHIAPLGACMSHDPSYIGLYRILVTVGTFFLLLSLSTVSYSTLDNFRNDIQHGCWLVKVIIIILLFTLLVNLPSKLSRVWLYISLGMTFLFTIIQLICLLDSVNIIQTSWSNSTRLNPSTLYYSSSSLTTFLYLISTAAFICFYIYFAYSLDCKVTRLFISINLVLCLSASFISIHPAVKTGGLLRSAIVTTFCMYHTWSSLNYNPNDKCNPLAHSSLMIEAKPSRDAASIIDIFFLIITLIYFTIRIKHIGVYVKKLDPRFLFSTLRCKRIYKERKKYQKQSECGTSSPDALTTLNENYEKADNIDLIEKWLESCEKQEKLLLENKKSRGQKLVFGLPNEDFTNSSNNSGIVLSSIHSDSDVDKQIVEYSYSWFHFTYFIAICYIFVLLTHWIEPVPGSNFQITIHWAIMTIKMVASGISVLFYNWTLIVPILIHLYQA